MQAAGRIVLDLTALGRGALFLSATSSAAPKASAPWSLPATLSPEPLLRGGGQERRQRSGTENIAAIAGLAAALAAASSEQDEVAALSRHLQRRFEVGLRSLARKW